MKKAFNKIVIQFNSDTEAHSNKYVADSESAKKGYAVTANVEKATGFPSVKQANSFLRFFGIPAATVKTVSAQSKL